MKSILITLVILSLLFSCKKNDNPIAPQETTKYNISIPDGFYSENPESETKTSGHVYLTDDEGEPITDDGLFNNTITELVTESDAANKFDLTFLTKTESLDEEGKTQTSYALKTFVNVNPCTLEFKNREPNSGSSDVQLIINNAHGNLTDFTYNGSYSSSSSSNRTEYETTVYPVPGNFYVSFKHEDELLRRYVLVENISESSTFTYEYNELPVVEDMISIDYPSNDLIWIQIEGALESEPDYFFAPLAQLISDSGEREHNFNIPISLFHNFKVITRLQLAEKYFYTEEVTDKIDGSYSNPDLDFQVLNNTIENYEFSSSSEFDYYQLRMSYTNNDANYRIAWSFYGPSQSNIKLTLPKILSLLDFGSEKPSFSDFQISSPTIEKLEGVKSYNNYIVSVISPTSRYEEGIMKYESYSK